MPKLSTNFLRGRAAFYIDAAAADMRTARNPPVSGAEAKAWARGILIERSRKSLEQAKEYRRQADAAGPAGRDTFVVQMGGALSGAEWFNVARAESLDAARLLRDSIAATYQIRPMFRVIRLVHQQPG